jgi:mycothiol synthase
MTSFMQGYYQGEDDFWRIRAFLRDVFLRHAPCERSWQVARLDYWRWHVNENILHLPLFEAFYLWETAEGQLAAVMNLDNPGDVHFQVHPNWESAELETAMLRLAEECVVTKNDTGQRTLTIWAHADDAIRTALLTQHGYTKGAWPEYQHYRSLYSAIPDAPPAAGYVIRALGDTDELPARSWASWRAFHPDEPDAAYEGWEWYHNIQRIPQYRRDLDLVAVSPDGVICGFCTVWLDDVTRTGMFEPVGIMPEHQQKGLGKALMSEGLRRLQKMGAHWATVGGYSPAANALYKSVMSGHYGLLERWEKVW